MARVTNPLLSQDASGSVGGVQFSRNRAGNFGSRKSTSNRKQGTVVTAHRARLKLAHSAWDDLSTGLKASWVNHAQPPLTGRNAFIGSCLTNLMIGAAPPDLPPWPIQDIPLPRYFRYRHDPPPLYDRALSCSPNIIDDRYIILYEAQPGGPYMPHVRKFKFYSAVSAESDLWECGQVEVGPWAAFRIVVWDAHRGISQLEIRAFFPWGADYIFEYPPL